MKKIIAFLFMCLWLQLFTACTSGMITSFDLAVSSDITGDSFSSATSSAPNQNSGLPTRGEPEYTFQSDSVGWATYRWYDSLTPDIYETQNGGATWQPAHVNVLPEMLEGAISAYTWPVRNANGTWVFSLFVKKDYGYPSNCFYDFMLDETDNTWKWKKPSWSLPTETEQIAFIDYILNQTIFNPLEYDSQQGLTELSSIYKMIFDAAFFEIRAGKELVNNVLPFDKVNELALYQYGDKNFDITSFLSTTPYLPTYTDEGFEIITDGPEAVVEGLETFISSVNMLEHNQIEVYTMTVYWGGGGNNGQDDPIFRRSLYIPTVYNDIPIFTLIFSEQLDFEQYTGTIPVSHWDM